MIAWLTYYKELKKLFMDIGLFKSFLLCSRRGIPHQAPVVVGQKIDIPSTLIVFLHNADVFVKTFSLFFSSQENNRDGNEQLSGK